MTANSQDRSAPLLRNEVHIWSTICRLSDYQTRRLAAILSPDERDRAERYRFEGDREFFVAARGFLRSVLALYLDVEPSDVRFEYGKHGKPRLMEQNGVRDLHFSLSHSGDLALCAVIWGREVGIDIEQVRDIPEAEAIARRFFSTKEADTLHALPVEQSLRAFFRCWTRKEAIAKALGTGLAAPLDLFDVSASPSEPPRAFAISGDATTENAWCLLDIPIDASFVAACATKGSRPDVVRCRWNGLHVDSN